MKIIPTSTTPSRKHTGSHSKPKPAPGQGQPSASLVAINPNIISIPNGSTGTAAPLFGSSSSESVKERSCFAKLFSGQCCLALAGIITAGILFIKRKFNKASSASIASSDSAQPMRPISPSQQSTQAPASESIADNDERLFLERTDSELTPPALIKPVRQESPKPIPLPQLHSQSTPDNASPVSPTRHRVHHQEAQAEKQESPASDGDDWIDLEDERAKID